MIDRTLSRIPNLYHGRLGWICILLAFTSLAVILPSEISSENTRCFAL